MNKRTDEEVQAYVDGYNACYDRFVEVLMQRGSVTKAIEKMDMFKEATNSVLLTENVGTCQQNVGTKSEKQTDGDLISRQEVLKCFNIRELKFKDKEDAELMKHYLELALDDLAKLPSYNSIKTELKTELNGNLISRKAVIDIVEFECGEWIGLAKTIVKEIEQLPSAEKTAEWTKDDECSNCGKYVYVGDRDNYCPHCGCKMKEVE